MPAAPVPRAMSEVERRLQAAGLQIPAAPKAAAAYIQHTKAGDLVFCAGQIPTRDGKPLMHGKCGRELSLAQAQEMARACARPCSSRPAQRPARVHERHEEQQGAEHAHVGHSAEGKPRQTITRSRVFSRV